MGVNNARLSYTTGINDTEPSFTTGTNGNESYSTDGINKAYSSAAAGIADGGKMIASVSTSGIGDATLSQARGSCNFMSACVHGNGKGRKTKYLCFTSAVGRSSAVNPLCTGIVEGLMSIMTIKISRSKPDSALRKKL